MKVAVVSSFDLDGGAARAAYRLHQALRAHGADSRMFVQVRTSSDPTVDGRSVGLPKLIGRLRPIIDHAPSLWMGTRLGQFSLNWLPGDLLARLDKFNPDIIHRYWINAGFVSLAQIERIGRSLIWTAHDMWPFTGWMAQASRAARKLVENRFCSRKFAAPHVGACEKVMRKSGTP